MKILTVIGLVLLAALAGFVYLRQTSNSMPKQSRVIYGTTLEPQDMEAAIDQCSKLGGRFERCGSACSQDDETCVDGCAFTCENIPLK